MKSLGELAMIESVNWYQRQLLSCFVYAGEVAKPSFPSLSNIIRYGKHEAVADVKIPFYQAIEKMKKFLKRGCSKRDFLSD